MLNATETTVPKDEETKAGCCGGTDAKGGDRPAVAVAADEAKSASHIAHGYSKHASGTGCCCGGKTSK